MNTERQQAAPEKNKKHQRRYLQGFGIAVVVLALVRAVFIDGHGSVAGSAAPDSIGGYAIDTNAVSPLQTSPREGFPTIRDLSPAHPVRGVRSYAEAFPDTNDLQLTAAVQYGIRPAMSREEAMEREGERLVYVGFSPFYYVDSLKRSIPYLVPKAALLLHDMGRAFFDSLQVKQVPLHRFVVSSVLRTGDDVNRLRGHNRNATERSCHLFATTFDISYNRFKRVAACDTCSDRAESDTLKRVLSEVLRDMRENGRCYVKHERKQGCFHITVR
ncbi:MAG: hypothetical protein IJM81_00520 [Prevotella sp.]|nr:hypothetical protein [Prevotella sp.]